MVLAVVSCEPCFPLALLTFGVTLSMSTQRMVLCEVDNCRACVAGSYIQGRGIHLAGTAGWGIAWRRTCHMGERSEVGTVLLDRRETDRALLELARGGLAERALPVLPRRMLDRDVTVGAG